MSNLVKRKNGKPTSECSVKATFAKALKANSEWTDKDEFLDVVYWLRQIIGLILGVVWGILPLKGFLGIVLFVAVNIAIVYVYTNMFQRVNDDEYGGISEILKEGFMTSFATFVVTWIIIYSSLYRHDGF